MVETLKTNTDLLETSNTAKEWTEKSPNSKLKDIQNLLNNPKNEKERELSNLIKKREYKKFQNRIGATEDGKLGNESFACLKIDIKKEVEIDAQMKPFQDKESVEKAKITSTETPSGAKEWTENSQSSKLNDIKELLQNSENTKIIKLSTMIENGQYTEFQQELGITPADGKLGGDSLYKLETFIENALQEQMMQPGEIWDKNERKEFGKNQQKLTGSFENKSKQEIGSGEYVIEGGKRKLQKGIELTGKQLKLTKIEIPEYDKDNHMVIFHEKNETISNISIKYIGKNICINNKYVLHPSGAICFYEEKNYLDTYANSQTSKYQSSLLKPLYDYLNKNKSTYEYSYISEPIIADGSGQHNNNFDEGQSTLEKKESGKRINETFPRIEIADINESSTNGIYIGKNIDLHVSNISKKGNTLILNNGEIEITNTNGEISYKLSDGQHSINVTKGSMSYTPHAQWKKIYNTLNAKYFS